MNIAIYIYDDAEVLDFSGPFEVFNVAKRLERGEWNIYLVSETGGTVRARGDFQVHPHYSMAEAPQADLLIISGGIHNRELTKPRVISWLKQAAEKSSLTASVCTGAFLLAETGLAGTGPMITHWEDCSDLRAFHPEIEVLEDRRWVRNGKFVSSAGISAGIDMSLYLVSELAGKELALKTARQMDYSWQRS